MKKRLTPELRALYERVRRPTIMIGGGLVLMVPAMTLKGPNATLTPAETLVAEVDSAIAATEAPIASAWVENAMKRERAKVASVFAERFSIPKELAVEIHEAAVEQNVDPKVAFGLVRTESSFRGNVVSSAGAVGYTQLLPSTARWIEPGTSRSELFDSKTNLQVGFKYLRRLIDKYDGDVSLALTAYNRGPGTVDRELRKGRNPDNGYYSMVVEGKNAHASGHQKKMKVKPGKSRRS